MSRLKIVLFTTLLLLMLTCGYFIVRGTTATRAEVHEQAIVQLEHAPAERVAELLGQLVVHSSEPEVLLSRCLRSSRPELIEATSMELTELLEAWRDLPRDQAALRLCSLVIQLEVTVPQMSPAGHGVARQMVEHALRWPLLPGSQQTPDLLASCQRSLAALDRMNTLHAKTSTEVPVRVAEQEAGVQTGQNPSPRMLPTASTAASRPLR